MLPFRYYVGSSSRHLRQLHNYTCLVIYAFYERSSPHNVIAAFCIIAHTAVQFSLSNNVTVSAANVRGFSTPAARVTWSTTAPPQCVASVRVDFRNSSRGPVVATYTTNSTSQTEVIQTGLQCTIYYITVVVTGQPGGTHVTLNSRPAQVAVGGKNIFNEL